jgi:hypothetical protein
VKTVAGWALFLLAVIFAGVGIESGIAPRDSSAIRCGDAAACAYMTAVVTPGTPMVAVSVPDLPFTSGYFFPGMGPVKWRTMMTYGGTFANPVVVVAAAADRAPFCRYAGAPVPGAKQEPLRGDEVKRFVLRGVPACELREARGPTSVMARHEGVSYSVYVLTAATPSTLAKLEAILSGILSR